MMKERITPALSRFGGHLAHLKCHMTGSGSTLFILAGADSLQPEENTPAKLAAVLSEVLPQAKCLVTRIM